MKFYMTAAIALLATLSFDSLARTLEVERVGGTGETKHTVNLPDTEVTLDVFEKAVKNSSGVSSIIFMTYDGNMIDDSNIDKYVNESQKTGQIIEFTGY